MAASGAGLTYRWKKDGVNLAEGGNLTGTKSPNLTISDIGITDAGMYACLVTGTCNSVSSNLAQVSVLKETGIDIQPVGQNTDEDSPVSFTVGATRRSAGLPMDEGWCCPFG